MANQPPQLTNHFANLTEDELRQAFLAAAEGPRVAGNHFFNQFKFRYDLFSGNAASTLHQGLDLLNRCHSIDETAFANIHKGSAYYWIGMAAWLMQNHELATLFFDAAVSEDIRAGHNPDDNSSPSFRYMLLEGESDEQAARDLVRANQARMEAEITMPELVGLDRSGSSDAQISGFMSTKSLVVDLSGNSALLGDIQAGDSRFDVSGNSSVTVTGSAGNVAVDASGSSEVDLTDFPASDGRVNASGASTVTANLSGRLDADASGSSDVYYLGDPTLGQIDTSGSSSIQPK